MIIASLLLHAALLSALPNDAVHPKAAEVAATSPERARDAASAEMSREPSAEENPVVTRHEVAIGGKSLKYTVTAGTLPVVAASGETEAHMFFVAYTADKAGNHGQRPLLFAFNGGPGSSSVWLHLGAIGPKRVKLPDDGSMPPPPYQLTDNDETWLDQADLVFVDPVGTGYSRAVKPDQAEKFFSLKGDMESVGEFIRLYLTRYRRWSSPLFLVGESYGSMRAAGLADNLLDHGIACNGIILVSAALNFSTISFTPGNDLPYALFLPSYTAIAWYHKKLSPDMGSDLPALLGEAEKWATTDYLAALAKGDRLAPAERQSVVGRLARYTGLDERYIDNSDLRIEAGRFAAELLRDRKKTVGRFDGRLLGDDISATAEHAEFDPSLAALRPPFTATFNDYVRGELGYRSDREYFILGGGIGRWDWGSNNSFADTGAALRSAFGKNPYMRLFVASGAFDLATPYTGSDYTLAHLGLDRALRRNITTARYPAGHMLYTDARSRAELKRDIADFLRTAASPR
ncbi:MAG TPA: peptidase S10 [Geobacteraceae bacterium]